MLSLMERSRSVCSVARRRRAGPCSAGVSGARVCGWVMADDQVTKLLRSCRATAFAAGVREMVEGDVCSLGTNSSLVYENPHASVWYDPDQAGCVGCEW